MTILGITGPTGSGKTTALEVLREMGAFVIDCDEVYHRLLRCSAELKSEIARSFPGALNGREIDRRKLGEIVFSDRRALDALNAITLRHMDAEVSRLLSAHGQNGGKLAAIDAIALIESGFGRRCDFVVGVTAPPELRARRIMLREGIGLDYAMKRIGAQQKDEFYRENCDYILENCGCEEDFRRGCRELFKKLTGGPEIG